MRLRRLDLTRYGKFTGGSIDFGDALEGVPDLHIIYGPNEAGKSTALAAFLDLLFGMEMQSRYNFLHDYSTMCVGGCLELTVGPRDLVRRKRPAPTLLNRDNDPVSENLILGDLGGIDRNAYRTMFLLDDDTLEAGGRSILASNGELGQLLFAASAGLSELSNKLVELRSEADQFTKQSARSGELHELKSSLATLKQQRDAIDTLASEYNRLASAKDEASRKYREALEEHRTVQENLGRVRRLLSGLPHIEGLRRLRQQLDQLAHLPDAPPGWLQELPAIQKRENELGTEAEIAAFDVQRLIQELEAIVVDDLALGLAGQLDRMVQLRARYIAADLDLPNVRIDLARAGAEVRGILTRLGHEAEKEPARLLLNAAQTATLNRLILSRSGIKASVAAASTELSKAANALTEAQRALGEHSHSACTASSPLLLPIIAAVRQSDHVHRLRAAEKRKAHSTNSLEIRIAGLAPWKGSAEALGLLAVPDVESVRAWAEEARRTDTLVAQRQEEVERCNRDVAASSAELEAIIGSAGLAGDQEAASIREVREAAWTEHRSVLDTDTAAAFEVAMRLDDNSTSARLSHARELAEIHEKKRTWARMQSDEEQARVLLKELNTRRQTQVDEFARVAAAICPEMAESMTPLGLLAWIDRWQQARDMWESIREAEVEIGAAEEDAARLRHRLAGALEQAVITFDSSAELEALMVAAEIATERENHVAALRQAVQKAEREVETRNLAVERASLEDKTWQSEWLKACSACWLGKEAAELPTDVVRELLATVAVLGPALQAEITLVDRVQGMENDQAAFKTEVERLFHELGLSPSKASAVDCSEVIIDKVDNATRSAGDRRRLQNEHVAASAKKNQAEAERLIHGRRAKEMMEQMRAGSLLELATKLRDAEQKITLGRQETDTESTILAALHVESMSAAEALLEGQSTTELETEQASLTSQFEILAARTRDLYAVFTRASDQMDAVGGDDAVAKIEEKRRTTLLTTEEKASRYLRLRVGVAAADRALRIYREQHRSSMMRHASDAFNTITRGGYRGLTTQPDRDNEVLVAVSADGGSKLATELSKGTRFQLYLALRAAGYHEFASVRQPVPFIADDIMETFDDLRAEETLRVFEGMARRGQVIYLTHHEHLRRMAEVTVPGVRIHEL
jgi:uncharacterized protein YhaN